MGSDTSETSGPQIALNSHALLIVARPSAVEHRSLLDEARDRHPERPGNSNE
jgi:hypothetical protein